jgi:hypothetical protein
MTVIDAALGLVVLVLTLVFFERRQRASYAQELARIGVAKARTDELVASLETLTSKTIALELLVEAGEDRRNMACKTFLESFAELIKISEEQRKHMQNKLQAKKLDK